MNVIHSIRGYGIHEHHKLAKICTNVWFTCFSRPKSCILPGKPYIGTQYNADYEKSGDQFSLLHFHTLKTFYQDSYLQPFEPESPVFQTTDISIKNQSRQRNFHHVENKEKNVGISATEGTNNPE